MKERPILFNAPMVRAILDGRKTQTRRLLKPQPPANTECFHFLSEVGMNELMAKSFKERGVLNTWSFFVAEAGDLWPCNDEQKYECPFGQPGDRLWVRETYNSNWGDEMLYKASCQGSAKDAGYSKEPRWRPSIHMPRWASRITLEITNVRVERLQGISEEDAKAEGAAPYDPTAYFTVGEVAGGNCVMEDFEYRAGFADLWNSIADDRSDWEANPWVWVIEFKRCA